MEEYRSFPPSAQLGFIYAIPEDTYDIATASITEVSFIGLFPKQIYHVLRSYGKQHPAIAAEFNNLIEDLISAFVYRPLTMQKVVHILIARQKEILAQYEEDDEQASSRLNDDSACNEQSMENTQQTEAQNAPSNSSQTQHHEQAPKRCYGIKCGILHAKGILHRTLRCATKQNTCSGCILEMSKQRKVKQLEQELLSLSIDNQTLAPLLQCRSEPIGLKRL